MIKIKKLRFKKIDAFASGKATGNPAGYVYLDNQDQLSNGEMQKVAAELKGFVNEVGFVTKKGPLYELIFYSSECEVSFCGHATIAIMYDILSTKPEFIDIPEQDESVAHITCHEQDESTSRFTNRELKIHVRAGNLSIFNHIKDEDAVYIMAPKPEYLKRDITLAEIADAMDLDEAIFDGQKPINIIDGGLRTLILPLVSLEGCLLLHPCQEKLKQFCLFKDIDIVLVFTNETSSPSANYRTRVFAPKYGYLEDPATGSGNSAFGYYLISNNYWSGDFSIEQGPSMSCPNIVKIKRYQIGDEDHILFGGNAIARIDGSYYLQEL